MPASTAGGGTFAGTAGGTLSGTGGTAAGTAGGTLSGTAGGTLSGTAGGTLSGTAGGTLSGTAGGTTAGGTLSGTAGGTLAGQNTGLGGLTGGTTGGIIGGLFGGGGAAGGTGGGTTPAQPLDPSITQPPESKLPQVKGTCPNIATGTVSVNGTTAQLTVGPGMGPMVFYWHGTFGSPDEVDQGLPGATAEIAQSGGVVASFIDTNAQGDDTGDSVWYTGDLDSADQILACAIQKGLIDTGRIYCSGYSAGGLQTGTMVLQRSGYLASAIVYSGGPPLGGLVPGSTSFSDPSNIPPIIGAHGAQGQDWLALDFHDGTLMMEDLVKQAGGFAIDCDDNGSHTDFFIIRAGVGGQAWKFLKDHPYNAKPDPYAGGLPSGYPSYCMIH